MNELNKTNTNSTQTEELQLNQRETYKLLAISPIDGRYYKYTSFLSNYFSEYAFFKYRLYIEIQYLQSLIKLDKIQQHYNILKHDISTIQQKLQTIYINFSINELEILSPIRLKPLGRP